MWSLNRNKLFGSTSYIYTYIRNIMAAVTDSQQGSAPNGTSDISQRKYLPPGKCGESDDPVNETKRKPAHKVRHVRTRDIADFEIGSFKRWLHFQLSRLDALGSRKTQSRTGRSSMKDIDMDLQPCLEDVLDLFNESDAEGNFKLEGGSAVKTKAYDAIMKELTSYADTADEQSRYGHFVKMSNMAFEVLSSMKMHKSKPAPAFDSENAVMFMVNHPTQMYTVYKDETYCQSPSILLGYKKDVQKVYPQASLDSVPLPELVTEGPSRPLTWSQALVFAEMESEPEALTAPPHSYAARILAERQSVLRESESGSRRSSSARDGDSSSLEEAGIAKRAGDYPSDQRPSKKRKTDSDVTQDRKIKCNIIYEITDEIRRLADIGAESMCACYGRDHVLGFVLTGSMLNLWIFDHEGPIQLIGFDFIQDFPHFLLLLYVLQRFNPEDFGFLPGFDECPAANEATYSMDLTSAWIFEDGLRRQVKLEGIRGEGIPHRYGLDGRSTGVRFGTATITEPGRHDEIRKVALKLSWKDTPRPTEREFIDEARKRICSSIHATKDAADPRNFLPEILAERKYTEFDTSIIRDAVLLDPTHHAKSKASRYPYMIVMPRYEPIHTLAKDSGFPLLNAFLALVYCHAVLWSLGIQHGDISDRNLMVDPVTGHPKLCDYDLSHFEGEILPECLFSNTGTWTFMAIELLTPQAMDGHVKRVYRHEVESFLAVLVWILLRYEDGQLLRDPPLSEWSSPSYYACGRNRQATYRLLPTKRKPGWLSSDIWQALLFAILKLKKLQRDVDDLQDKMYAKNSGLKMLSDEHELSPEDVRRWEELNDMGFVREVLNWRFFELQTDGPKWESLMTKLLL
ncbi:hypothetical protein D9613_001122 [Agrocybe pediades]|uniref:Fungal-type protein kinase domain-containing protein n=1 Tax=Agrocybe pediades TaxID=84607 RepID=A0A8H4VRU9_9AGAR|nr:hypothetical protein D9613_001122 [Agrocybe pediades]